MSDTITQTRLSMRLDAYLREYTGKNVRKDALSKAEWNKVWRAADVARTHNTLTPELVDDVRKALKKLEATREMPL
jgi:two-component SAPR family response regulator